MIGDVEYDEAGFDLMRDLYALAQPSLDGDMRPEIEREAATIHEIYRQFPGVRLVEGDDHGTRAESPTGQSLTARPGRFYGSDATETERASGEAVEGEDLGPLKPGSAAHSVLIVYGDRSRRTSYQASLEACDDFHARRRESTRLLTRGFLMKSGTLPNPAPGGREHVDAYRITDAGLGELRRLA